MRGSCVDVLITSGFAAYLLQCSEELLVAAVVVPAISMVEDDESPVEMEVKSR